MTASFPGSVKNFTDLVDGMDEMEAANVNDAYAEIEAIESELAAELLRGGYANTETLADTLALADTDPALQYLDPGGAARDVTLPAEGDANHLFVIVNTADAAETITVKDDGANTIGTVAQGEVKIFVSNSVAWKVVSGGGSTLSKATAADVTAGTDDDKYTTSKALKDAGIVAVNNYTILPSVASNNLTVALKTLSGNDPSASSPIYVRIGNTLHAITSAMSVACNAGSNWFNSGGAELATKEVDYFVYLGYNAVDGVTIGFSRIPYARLYSEFSATNTNEKYAAISVISNAAAGDNYENIGRFPATLSAGAGYTWTIPSLSASNLIHKPIGYTRKLVAGLTQTGFSSAPTGSILYELINNQLNFIYSISGAGTSNSAGYTVVLPFAPQQTISISLATTYDNGAYRAAGEAVVATNGIATLYLSARGAWTTSGAKFAQLQGSILL